MGLVEWSDAAHNQNGEPQHREIPHMKRVSCDAIDSTDGVELKDALARPHHEAKLIAFTHRLLWDVVNCVSASRIGDCRGQKSSRSLRIPGEHFNNNIGLTHVVEEYTACHCRSNVGCRARSRLDLRVRSRRKQRAGDDDQN